MRKINDLAELQLPLSVWQDIHSRISDWLASGGKESDPYIQRQIEYGFRVYEECKRRNNNDL